MKSKTILGYRKDFGPSDIKANLFRLAGQLRGRNRAVFLAQLFFALWLLAAKAIVTAEGHSKTKGAPSAPKKAAIIDGLFKQLRIIYPGLPLRRMLDSWCDCLLGALIELQVIKLPPRERGQKHLKVELKHLRKVRKGHLLKIVKDYESMAELRDALFPPAKKPVKVKDDELLELTHQFLLRNPVLNPEKLAKLRSIKEAAEIILLSVGSSPTDEPPSSSASSSPSSSASSSPSSSASSSPSSSASSSPSSSASSSPSSSLSSPSSATASGIAPKVLGAHKPIKATAGKNGNALTAMEDTPLLPFPPESSAWFHS